MLLCLLCFAFVKVKSLKTLDKVNYTNHRGSMFDSLKCLSLLIWEQGWMKRDYQIEV